MGHRVPNHKSKCSSVHGHRYKAIINLSGDVVQKEGVSDQGMVMDFGDIKTICNGWIDKYLDHAYMGHDEHDSELLKLLHETGQKVFPVKFIPTAENIAEYLFNTLKPLIKDIYDTDLQLQSIELWETPNCSVLYLPPVDLKKLIKTEDKKEENKLPPILCDRPGCNKDHRPKPRVIPDPVVSGMPGGMMN
ncbi:MAG: 6-carboxytetrahydropterin synthase [Candidatus Peribacteraceae bacterium]|nr:6-carboxytetrahydropterin synthase [Candidatus Peribacteraceae bacterium]